MNFILKNFSLDELENLMVQHKYPKYRAHQIYEWLYKHNAINATIMKNLPSKLKFFLDQECTFETLSLSNKSVCEGTVKFLFKTRSGQYIESVSMIEDNRHTICLSSQVGCNVDCDFCATGKMGFKKNLSVGEIIDQLIFIKNNINTPITNIVFMGMGEPFLNYKNVIQAANIMNDKKAFNIGARRITISTAGMLPQIKKFIKEKKKYKLAISLNDATNLVRNKIMPINKKWTIEELIDVGKEYSKLKNRQVMF